jgi:hypothetical protein
MSTKRQSGSWPDLDQFLRLPGLFRRWEFEQVIEGSGEFHIEAAGETDDGTTLFAVYCLEQPLGPESDR